MGLPTIIYLILAMIMPEDEKKSVQDIFFERAKRYTEPHQNEKRKIKEAEKVYKDN